MGYLVFLCENDPQSTVIAGIISYCTVCSVLFSYLTLLL